MNQKSEYRGYASLFLNEFAGTANELPSHAQDRDNLSKSLSKMRYKVVLNENKNKQETIDTLKQYAEFDHLNVDSFLCVFSSHGHERGFAANDGEVFDLTSEILKIFSGRLVGKPKLFFIDACRGDKMMKTIQPTDLLLGTGSSEITPERVLACFH
jgi:hypothetical protein